MRVVVKKFPSKSVLTRFFTSKNFLVFSELDIAFFFFYAKIGCSVKIFQPQMQTLGRFCLLVVTYTVLELYQRFLRVFLGFLVMDFSSTLNFLTQASEIGCGFFLLGCFSRVCNVLGMILIFGFCMKFLHFGWHSQGLIRYLFEFGGKPRNRLSLKHSVGEECESKTVFFKCCSLKVSQNPSLPNNNNLTVGKEIENSNGYVNSMDFGEEKVDNDSEVYDEDQEFDVMTLRKLVKIERQRANAAYTELEKERLAAASATDEAMAMIRRLQSEKSSVEIQANQYRRMVEQKQEYDQDVIESLRWIIMKEESERVLLQDLLKLYREKLRQYMREDEINQFDKLDDNKVFWNIFVEDDPDGTLISSLEMESQTL